MLLKKYFRKFVFTAALLALLAIPSNASAWTFCSSPYAVQWGDTIASVAYKCGTTMTAIRQSNPGLGYWLYAGQQIVIPGSYGGYTPNATGAASRTYVVQWGDTMHKIAMRMNVSLNDLIAANPQIWNPNWIFAGQVIILPAPAQFYTIQYGDTLQIIAARFGTSVYALETLNHFWNPNLIFAGQVIRLW